MEALRIGDQAPEFTLAAANREGCISLAEMRSRAAVAIEFLRGTW